MLVNMKDLLHNAKDDAKAIPQFNINNLEWTRYILEESQVQNNPVILGVSEGAIKHIGGYRTTVKMVEGLIEDLNITIPVVIHLDHGSSYESCIKAINAGFTSVMIDASDKPLNENIRITKSIVDYAHSKNVTVEGEIGHIGLATTDAIYTDVVSASNYAKETNVDALAPAVGSLHGLYLTEPKINFDRIKEISEETKLPLVLHGGTGIPENVLHQAIKLGISKLNINTALQVVWAKEVRKYLNENTDIYDPRKVIGAGEIAIKKTIDHYIEFLNRR